jgi:hypothetical protein
LNVSRDVINLRTFNSAIRAPILFNQVISYAVTAEQLLAFSTHFRMSYQVSAQPAFEGIQVLLDLALVRYPLWGEIHSTLLMIQTPVLLLGITEMGEACWRKFVITDSASRQELVGLFPILHLEEAVKFMCFQVFMLEKCCTATFLIFAEVLDLIDHLKHYRVSRLILSIFLVAIGT